MLDLRVKLTQGRTDRRPQYVDQLILKDTTEYINIFRIRGEIADILQLELVPGVESRGPQFHSGQVFSMRYKGRFLKGLRSQDRSFEEGYPLSF